MTGHSQTGWAVQTSGDSIGTEFVEDSAFVAAKYIVGIIATQTRTAAQAGSGFAGTPSMAGSGTGATPADDHAAEPGRAAAYLSAAGHKPIATDRLTGHSDSLLRVDYLELDYCSMTLSIFNFLIDYYVKEK